AKTPRPPTADGPTTWAEPAALLASFPRLAKGQALTPPFPLPFSFLLGSEMKRKPIVPQEGNLMTSEPPAGGQVLPGEPGPALCKRPGCGNTIPAQDRGRARVFCSGDCARRFHNNARTQAPAAPQLLAAGALAAEPLTALDAVIRQAAVLTRAAREQAAGLDPARVRAQIADAEAARRRAEAAAVTAEARAAEAAAETEAIAEALEAAREDTRAAQARAQSVAAA